MKPSTLKALQASISKWERIVLGTGFDAGSANCGLCKEFVDNRCLGCPVRNKTKRIYCRGSPYDNWEKAYDSEYRAFTGERDHNWHEYSRRYPFAKGVIGPKTMRAAIEEHSFLVSLLPK